MRKIQTIQTILVYLILMSVAVITLFPIFYTLMGSFKTAMEFMAYPGNILPRQFTVENYIIAWNSEFLNLGIMIKNSLIYTICCLFASLTTSSMCGYVFARGEFRFKKLIFAVFTSLMFVSLGSITVYPLFEILKLLHLNQSLYGLIVVNCFGIPVTNIYLVRSYVKSLPRELDEAAIIDGCNFIQIFVKIILPMLKPMLATLAILGFNASWNDYLMPSIFTLTRPEQRTLIVGITALKNSSEGATNWSLMLAGASIVIVPIIIIFIIGNRFFVKGIATGAVKG